MCTLESPSAPFRMGAATSQVESTPVFRQPASLDHIFANNVRFLSMAAIIAVHAIASYPALVQLPSIPSTILYFSQPVKFGSIGFFLVAGFLFGERIDAYSPIVYFKRRLRNVFVPWLLWFSLFCVMFLASDVVHKRLVGSILSGAFTVCRGLLLDSPFWFVPNLLLALALLLLFRRFLIDVRMGLVLLLASLFYGVNIYGQWVAVVHTRAVFGFVFYLWLGAWCAWNFSALEKRLARIPVSAMLGLIALTLTLALAESKLLVSLGSIDPMNVLRISNQIYSVVVVLGIVKVKHALWPRFVDVRKNTFGLYLTHFFGIVLLAMAVKRILPHWGSLSMWRESSVGLLLILVVFCLTYAGSLLVVKVLVSNPRLRWAVGVSARSGALVRQTQKVKIGAAPDFIRVSAIGDVSKASPRGLY